MQDLCGKNPFVMLGGVSGSGTGLHGESESMKKYSEYLPVGGGVEAEEAYKAALAWLEAHKADYSNAEELSAALTAVWDRCTGSGEDGMCH